MRLLVSLEMIALAAVAGARSKRRNRRHIGNETKPLEVVQDAPLELASRALAIVILDAQPNDAACATSLAPDVDRVEQVTEVQMSCRRGSEAGYQLQIDD
jgi:hypothetical protein